MGTLYYIIFLNVKIQIIYFIININTDTIFNQRGIMLQMMGTNIVPANVQPYQQQRLSRLINQNSSRFRDVQQNNRQRGVMKQSSGGQLEVAGAVVGIWGANYSMATTGNPYIGRGNNMVSSQHVRFLKSN